MGLSTERKVFLGLFLVAGGALLLDQAVLGPKSAGAALLDSVGDLTTEAITEPAEQAKQAVRSTAAELLNERLNSMTESFSTETSVSSMFGMPTIDELPVVITPDQQSIGAVAIVDSDTPRLSAVMPSSSGGAAVINGVLVRAGGKTSDGYSLITVEQRSVVIAKDGKEYTVSLPAYGD